MALPALRFGAAKIGDTERFPSAVTFFHDSYERDFSCPFIELTGPAAFVETRPCP
jgi:hypothetical protein